MDAQNRLLFDALTTKMRELLKVELESINERIDQLENRQNNSEEEERRRRRRDEAREDRLGGIKIKVPQFVGKNDPETYLEWETKIEQIFSCYNYTELQKVRVASIEFTDYALVWWDQLTKDRRKHNEPVIAT